MGQTLGSIQMKQVDSSTISNQLYAHKVWNSLLYSTQDTMCYWIAPDFRQVSMLPSGHHVLGMSL